MKMHHFMLLVVVGAVLVTGAGPALADDPPVIGGPGAPVHPTAPSGPAGPPGTPQKVQYAPTDVGSLNGATTTGAAVNDAGTVVGTSGGHAFSWSDGRIADLGALDGGTSAAVGINDSGLIAGNSTDATGAGHAVVWRDQHLIDLGPGAAFAVNDPGQVLVERPVGADTHRFLWQDGEFTDLGVRAPGTETVGLTDAGDVLGTFPVPTGNPCDCGIAAGILHDGTVTTFGALGTGVPDPVSRPSGANDDGDVVGTAAIDQGGTPRPFLWHDGALTRLPVPGDAEGVARDVSPGGFMIVGRARADHDPAGVPVAWDSLGQVRDLTEQGFTAGDDPVQITDTVLILANRDGHAYLYR
jgi:probable HAF family extracellular repeat protein